MITGHHTNAISRRILGAKGEGETRVQAAEMRVLRKIAGVRRMDHVRNEDIRAQLRQEGVVEQVGRKRELGRNLTGRRANWIYFRDGNKWCCTREKTNRKAKKAME